MNSQSDTMHDSALGSRSVAASAVNATRPLYWSVRREIWENRSIYIAPLAAAALFLVGFLIGAGHLPSQMRTALALDAAQQRDKIAQPYDYAAGMIMITALIVAVFYSLDALYGERRDRSILFWKSMPVSDQTTVLAKASVPLVILPLFAWALIVATQFIMLLLHSAVLLGSGQSVAVLWAQLSLFQMSLMLLYHLVTVHSLWHAPLYGWLLFVSSWARRAPFLWASLPVLGIIAIERIVFNSSHFAMMLGNRLAGGPEAIPMKDSMPIDPGMQLTPGHFLASPGLWIGLLVTAGFLAGAIRLRRYRSPI